MTGGQDDGRPIRGLFCFAPFGQMPAQRSGALALTGQERGHRLVATGALERVRLDGEPPSAGPERLRLDAPAGQLGFE